MWLFKLIRLPVLPLLVIPVPTALPAPPREADSAVVVILLLVFSGAVGPVFTELAMSCKSPEMRDTIS